MPPHPLQRALGKGVVLVELELHNLADRVDGHHQIQYDQATDPTPQAHHAISFVLAIHSEMTISSSPSSSMSPSIICERGIQCSEPRTSTFTAASRVSTTTASSRVIQPICYPLPQC